MDHFFDHRADAETAVSRRGTDHFFLAEAEATTFPVPAGWVWMSSGHVRPDGRRYVLYKMRDPEAALLDATPGMQATFRQNVIDAYVGLIGFYLRLMEVMGAEASAKGAAQYLRRKGLPRLRRSEGQAVMAYLQAAIARDQRLRGGGRWVDRVDALGRAGDTIVFRVHYSDLVSMVVKVHCEPDGEIDVVGRTYRPGWPVVSPHALLASASRRRP